MESDNESVASQPNDDLSETDSIEGEATDDELDSDIEDDAPPAKAAAPSKPNEYDDSDEEEDDDYLEKFDASVRKSVVEMHHPEAKAVNQAEMLKMATVTRDDRGTIVDDLHRSIPMMTKYEYATILGQRAQQLDEGDTPLVKVPNGVMDGYLIAQMELDQKRIPFIIKRPIPGSGFEYWHVEDLELVLEPLH